ncbi:hypothetical protein ACFQDG_10505 [Natronoarchaeum mannanilyticum]
MARRSDDMGVLRPVALGPVHWAMIALALLTGGIHLYVAATTGEPAYAVLGIVLLAGLGVFFTRWFAPPLYLVGAVYVSLLLVAWVIAGQQLLALAIVDKLVQVALIVVFAYLLVIESGSASENGP